MELESTKAKSAHPAGGKAPEPNVSHSHQLRKAARRKTKTPSGQAGRRFIEIIRRDLGEKPAHFLADLATTYSPAS
jgi:hypothetical protein